MHRGRLSIRARLVIVIGVLLIAGFLTTNIISFRVSAQTLKTTILENELPLTSSNIYSEIQADLLRPVFVSSLMSNDTFLKDWVLEGERDTAAITRYLEEIRHRYGVFTSFFISEATRRYYHFTGVAQVVEESDPRDVWFFRIREMKKPYEINIDYNQAQGNAVTIFVNYRVLDYDGNFIGVTGVGLAIDSVANVIERYGQTFGRNVFFVAQDGTITVRSGNPAITADNIRDIEGMTGVAEDLLAQENGYFEYQRGGEAMLATTRFIPELGWHVVVEQLESEAFKNLWHGFLTNLGIGAVVVALTMTAIAYGVHLYQRRLEHMATHDGLTGIGNRHFFDVALEQALKLRRRHKWPVSVILMDLDHFKTINDSLGHLVGDQVLCKVVEATRRRLRDSDIIARWGGEEIIVLAHDCDLEAAMCLAEEVRAAVAAEPILEPDDGRRVTVSIGVAEIADDEDAQQVVARADVALYRAKEDGRNRTVAARAPAMPVSA